MNANTVTVLNYLKKNFPNEKTKEEIMNATGLSAGVVQGALIGFGGLKRNNVLNDRVETIEIEPAVEATENTRGRKAKVKNIHYYALNEDGLTFEA